jgi:hypothetical protein
MIVLGDQSPWLGGLLRLKALHEAGEEVAYYFADLDTPTCGSAAKPMGISEGWPEYSSVACRYPWTLDAPLCDKGVRSKVANSLKLPTGQRFLTGYKSGTIAHLDQDRDLNALVEGMLREEVDWATSVAQLLGLQVPTINLHLGNVKGVTSQLSELLIPSPPPIQSFMAIFKKELPKLWGIFGPEEFWRITPAGGRYPLERTLYREEGPNSSVDTIVPRGRILPLELAMRGWEIGCTNLPYIQDAVRLRNWRLPTLPLRVVKVKFNWTLPGNADPLEKLKEKFLEKKRQRLSLVGNPMSQLDALEAEVSTLALHARKYWRERPSVISYLILGGELGVSITRETL